MSKGAEKEENESWGRTNSATTPKTWVVKTQDHWDKILIFIASIPSSLPLFFRRCLFLDSKSQTIIAEPLKIVPYCCSIYLIISDSSSQTPASGCRSLFPMLLWGIAFCCYFRHILIRIQNTHISGSYRILFWLSSLMKKTTQSREHWSLLNTGKNIIIKITK